MLVLPPQFFKFTICLDFDGVIHSYTSGWKGATCIPDKPVKGVRAAIKKLRKKYRVVVYSARCVSTNPGGLEAVAIWLAKYRIAVDQVCAEKPIASVYLDDRGLQFKGDWKKSVKDINNFKHWQARDIKTWDKARKARRGNV